MSSLLDTLYNIPDFTLSDIAISGNGQKQLLVVCSKDKFTEAEKTTLQRLIAAIKYDFNEDICLIYMDLNQEIALSQLGITYSELLVFGVQAELLGFHCDYRMNEVIYFDQKRVLFTDSIHEINAVPKKKEVLWKALQQMFLNKK